MHGLDDFAPLGLFKTGIYPSKKKKKNWNINQV